MLLPGLCILALVKAISCECIINDDKNIFLWSVRKEDTGAQGYLFGTIHVPYTEVWDKVSDRVRDAFALSDTVLLEVDLNNEDTLRKLVRCKKLPRKQSALSYLPADLFARIKSFMAKFRQHLANMAEKNPDLVYHAQQMFDNVAGNWHRKRPEWLLFTLYQLCENLIDRSHSPMLDVFLATKAIEEKKTLEALETAEEQCNPVSSLSLEDIVFAINYTTMFLEKLYFGGAPVQKGRSLTELIQHYRCGSLEDQLLNSNDFQRNGGDVSLKERERAKMIDEALKEDIITRRNERMALRVDRLMIERPRRTIFTAIGTGHFLGNNSIIHHLKEKGYTVTPVKNDDVLPSRKRNADVKFKPLWTRDFVPPPPIVVIEMFESSSSFFSSFSLLSLILLRFFL